jgi:hypothetical protein
MSTREKASLLTIGIVALFNNFQIGVFSQSEKVYQIRLGLSVQNLKS